MKYRKAKKLAELLETWSQWFNEYGAKGIDLHRADDGAVIHPPLGRTAILLGCKPPCTTKCAIFSTCKKRKDLEK
jgi:hypothetical protein